MHVIVSFFLDFCFLKDSDMMSKWNGEERTIFVEILSNPEFIEDNLGLDRYTKRDHDRILAAWEDLKRSYDEELANLDSNVELN